MMTLRGGVLRMHGRNIRFGQDLNQLFNGYSSQIQAPPGWLSGERVGLTTWWLRVRSPVEATFPSGVFSPLTSAEACEKSSRWLWKEICVSTGVRKPDNTYASPTAMILPLLLKWR